MKIIYEDDKAKMDWEFWWKNIAEKEYCEIYNGNINARSRGLISLKGAPKIINGSLDLNYNDITSFEDSDLKEVKGNLDLTNNPISSLKNMPKCNALILGMTEITSFKDLNESVKILSITTLQNPTCFDCSDEIVLDNLFICHNIMNLKSTLGFPKLSEEGEKNFSEYHKLENISDLTDDFEKVLKLYGGNSAKALVSCRKRDIKIWNK